MVVSSRVWFGSLGGSMVAGGLFAARLGVRTLVGLWLVSDVLARTASSWRSG